MDLKKIAALGMLVCCGAVQADRVALTLENDCLLKHADNDYTHGTGLEYVHDVWHVKLQQNMYAPEDITAKEHIVGDRPYCGWLGAELGREMFKDVSSPWTHYLGGEFWNDRPVCSCGRSLEMGA